MYDLVQWAHDHFHESQGEATTAVHTDARSVRESVEPLLPREDMPQSVRSALYGHLGVGAWRLPNVCSVARKHNKRRTCNTERAD